MKKIFIIFILFTLSYAADTMLEINKSPLVNSDCPNQKNTEEPTPINPRVAFFHIDNNVDMKITMRNLVVAARDKSIRGLIIQVNNTGGQAGVYSALQDLILAIKVEKPVVALIAGNAMSGGYMAASAADYIIASRCAEIGSIGVMQETHKYENIVLKKDIEANDTVTILTAGKYKNIYNPYCNNPEAHNYLQKHIETLHQEFINIIIENRPTAAKTLEEWKEANIFIAPQGLQLGLIDKIGTILDAEEKIIELLKGQKPDILWSNKIDYLYCETELPKK